MLIFDIKRYAINDGPGIRITIFMKGCPLSCVWCHNPEGISLKKQKLYTKKKCIGCRTCVDNCPQEALILTTAGIITDFDKCKVCGKCVDLCPTLAMEMSGTEHSIDYLMEQIEKETVFIDRSEGGVTFCGGEPLMHPTELIELLKRCGTKGIHRAVDTTLFASPTVVREVMDNCELFLVDLKHMNSVIHEKYCGVPNELILSNIKMIAEARKNFYIRIPLIEGVNANNDNIIATAEFLASLNWERKIVNVLPYHDIGKGKDDKLGKEYNPLHYSFSAPSDQRLKEIKGIFTSYGLDMIVGG